MQVDAGDRASKPRVERIAASGSAARWHAAHPLDADLDADRGVHVTHVRTPP